MRQSESKYLLFDSVPVLFRIWFQCFDLDFDKIHLVCRKSVRNGITEDHNKTCIIKLETLINFLFDVSPQDCQSDVNNRL